MKKLGFILGVLLSAFGGTLIGYVIGFEVSVTVFDRLMSPHPPPGDAMGSPVDGMSEGFAVIVSIAVFMVVGLVGGLRLPYYIRSRNRGTIPLVVSNPVWPTQPIGPEPPAT